MVQSEKKKKWHKRTTFLLIFLTVFAFFGYTWEKNAPARSVKIVVEQELNEWLQTASEDDEKSLHNVAGIEWDWVCAPNHYSSGMKSMRRHFKDKKIKFSAFSVADETLLDAEFGLTFISLDKKILVTIPVDCCIDFTRLGRHKGCVEGTYAGLVRVAGAKSTVSLIRNVEE
jgi:hypothetical protein